MQREDQLTMETGLEHIAAKARCEPKLRFTSLAHHITRERVQRNLLRIPQRSAAGVDGQTVKAAKESFGEWIEPMLQSIHRQGYRAPAVRRVYIPKPGKTEKRPLGVPTVSDRALQRSTAEVLSAIYEQDFLPCSFGGRPHLSAHHALSTLNEAICGGRTSWVLEADLKDYFGSLSHEWLLRFVEHRVGDPRVISLIRRWLKAGVLEDGAVHPSDEGTPQGGSISVLLSNVYLHYVLDLWFERVVKVQLKGEARLVRYIDDWATRLVVSIAGRKHWLWRAVDQDGYVLDEIVQSRRDTRAARRLLRRLLRSKACHPSGSSPTNSAPIVRPNVTSCQRSNTGLIRVSTIERRILICHCENGSTRCRVSDQLEVCNVS
ncbi:reverse transcriptase domain-containing protein [Rhizobium sp. T1470]|uniref:reverse transcriptase domain-containing protein n=1 Tax=Rhizobium sp. T1470 TaxID=555320 RepID=UPI0035CF496E